jgi:hypothetical protein
MIFKRLFTLIKNINVKEPAGYISYTEKSAKVEICMQPMTSSESQTGPIREVAVRNFTLAG